MLAQRPDLTRIAAAEFVESRGAGALRILRERAELAEQLGHRVAAQTWRRMLANAETLVEADDTAGGSPRHAGREIPRELQH